MAYIKNEWKTGDTIFATNLNHMEDGIEVANYKVLSVIDNQGTLNKTWKQINDCLVGGGIICISTLNETSQDGLSCATAVIPERVYTTYETDYYEVLFEYRDGRYGYIAPTQDDYPAVPSVEPT